MSGGRRARGVTMVAALVAQMVVVAFLYLPATLVVPSGVPWALLNLGGATFTAGAAVLAHRRRRAALAVPALSVAFWVAYVSAGEALFGWTA